MRAARFAPNDVWTGKAVGSVQIEVVQFKTLCPVVKLGNVHCLEQYILRRARAITQAVAPSAA